MTCADRMSRGSGVEARRSQAACGALSPLKQDVMEEEQERREERTSDTSLSSQSTAAIVRIRSIVVVVDDDTSTRLLPRSARSILSQANTRCPYLPTRDVFAQESLCGGSERGRWERGAAGGWDCVCERLGLL